HRNAVNNAMRQQPLIGWSPNDRMTWLYSPGVMGATRALTAALLFGAALFPRDPRQDTPARLAEWLRSEGITLYHSVASLFRTAFGQLDDSVLLPAVRMVIFGGEAVGQPEVELVRKHFTASCHIYTGLGTTETGTVSHLLVDPHANETGSSLPLGYPVKGVQVRLKDEDGRDVPSGEVGEIVVESAFLATGYWRQPELTAARFVEVPGKPKVRRYYTGDLGRTDPDGLVRHVSRKDFQVKIRGFRIEVGEIEAALQRHPSVRETVVVGLPGTNGETVLAAYCAIESGSELGPQEFRRFLAERLPLHMVPASITIVPFLPRTPNGKIDRRSLPTPGMPCLPASDFPQGAIEEHLAQIWSEVLGRPGIGRHDDFFAVGGHSLMAMQVAARILRTFAIEVSPQALFEHASVARQALYVQLLKVAPGQAGDLPLAPTRHETWLPLSFAQERIWFLERLEPGSTTYHINRAFRLRGDIDIKALQSALTGIVARHEVLRTVYAEREGAAAARVLPPAVVPLPVSTLERLCAAESPETTWLRFAEDQAQRPFNLQRDLPIRAAVGRLDREIVFTLTVHHIAADAGSLVILLRELAGFYQALRRGEPLTLSSPPLQYADYAWWQRSRMDGARRDEHVAFWRNALAGAPPVLELPSEVPRSASDVSAGSVYRFVLPEPVTNGMRTLAQRAGVTPFVAWLAAFQVLLARLTGSTDILVASPVGGRTRVELEPLIGCFVNTVVFRGNLAANPSFNVFLPEFGEGVRAALAHNEMPFELLVQELQPRRMSGSTPLAQVMFAWQSESEARVGFALEGATPLQFEGRTAKFELTLSLEETKDGLAGVFEYAAPRFAPDTIAAWAGHLFVLAEAIILQPATRVGELPLLQAAERFRLIETWGGAGAALAPPGTVLEGFAQQVARAPGAIAIRGAGGELSYADLDSLSDQVAKDLCALGVRPGDIVAICLDRRVELGAALMGVLKAGAGFLPLDPSYPGSRLEFMLRDSEATALVVSQANPISLKGISIPKLHLDNLRERPRTGRLSQVRSKPADVAYLIYTSGSTGEPKGVAVSHGALWQHNCAIADLFALTAADRVLQFCALSFDVMIEEVFPTWLRGATVVLRAEDAARSLGSFCRQLTADRVTVLNLPTAFWHELVDALGGVEMPPSVRLVAIGGEQAALGRLRRWQEHIAPGVRLLNAYGPTEATITTTVFEASSFTGETVTGGIPIGRPLAGTRAYVLDAYDNPTPIGVWGELYLGGCSVAVGYWQRPKLNAERFRPDPFTGARMYRTGDVVRWLSNGALEFRGRADEQVKLRGFRIELGEIENALRAVSGVRDAAVT
ncbi:MAG: hypothetical protein RIQ93_3078, partial [Verrucomicrobiota bacterium]